MRRISLAAVVLALAMVSAGCLGTVQAQSDGEPTTADVDGPTISVATSGEVAAHPDLAVVRVAVEATAETATAARERVATDADAMRAALRDAGIADDQVTTSGFAIYPEYEFSGRERELVGYRASHAFTIEVTDVSRAGETIDVAVDNGATRVDGVQFTLADDTRTELREQALTRAMDAARADADAIAAAGDLTVTGVHTVSTSDGGFSGPFPVFADGRESGASTTLDPGTVTVTARVDVVYTAEAAA